MEPVRQRLERRARLGSSRGDALAPALGDVDEAFDRGEKVGLGDAVGRHAVCHHEPACLAVERERGPARSFPQQVGLQDLPIECFGQAVGRLSQVGIDEEAVALPVGLEVHDDLVERENAAACRVELQLGDAHLPPESGQQMVRTISGHPSRPSCA